MFMLLKNQLFDLIKSMDQSEKRQFKIAAAKYIRKEKSSYLKLFDVIDKMNNYDEERIHRLLKHEKFITRLAVEKNTLYKLILKSLKSSHSPISEDAQVKHLLLEAELLFKKSLYVQSKRLLIKAEKIAFAYGLRFQLLEIYKWQRTLWNMSGRKNDINVIIEKEEKIIKEIENDQQYNKLYASLILLMGTYGYNPREKEALDKLAKIMANPLLMNGNKAISNSAQQTYHNIHANFSLVYDKYKDAYYHYGKQIELMKLIPDFIQNHLEQYMATTYNGLICLMRIDKDKALKQLVLFRNIPSKKIILSNLRIRQFILSSYELELSLLINYCMFKQAKQLIPEMKTMLQNNQKIIGISRYSNVCYASSYVYFVLKEYKTSLKFLNEIINLQEETEVSNDLKAATRVLSMFIHYEINNKELLPYLERSVKRFLNKNEVLYETEKSILKFFRKTLTNEIAGDLLKKEFVKFKSELIAIFKNPVEKQFLERFDIISWIESKIKDKTFEEVLKKEAQKMKS